MKRYVTAFTLLFIAACGGGETSSDEQPVEQTGAEEPVSLEGSKCLGDRVPPSNYKQATAFVSASTANAADVAARKAKADLRDRICQGYRCHVIEPKISLWNTQADAAQVCAMAVVKATEVQAFLDEPRIELDREITRSGAELVEKLGKEGVSPRIGIDNVRDIGVDGGPRAEWLIDKMKGALLEGGAVVARLPNDWSGLGVPKDVDAVVRGRVTRLHGQEAMLEVTWSLDVANATAATSSVQFPELIGPVVDADTMMPDIDDTTRDLSLRFASRPGGGLCAGQRTELFLESSRPLHTRVINLFGTGDQALLIHASDGKMEAKAAKSLGKFKVVPFEETTPVERFLVIGADEPSGLGKFEAVPIPCRIPSDAARELSRGRGIPPAATDNVTTRSYRILDGEDCADFSADPQSVDKLKSFPMCW